MQMLAYQNQQCWERWRCDALSYCLAVTSFIYCCCLRFRSVQIVRQTPSLSQTVDHKIGSYRFICDSYGNVKEPKEIASSLWRVYWSAQNSLFSWSFFLIKLQYAVTVFTTLGFHMYVRTCTKKPHLDILSHFESNLSAPLYLSRKTRIHAIIRGV